MYNKIIIEFAFCDIRNNQGLRKCNKRSWLITLALSLIIPDIAKTLSNYCLKSHLTRCRNRFFAYEILHSKQNATFSNDKVLET